MSATKAATAARSQQPQPEPAQPLLLFFYSATSGASRRADGFLAQVLQRRANHETFRIYRVDIERRPDLQQRFSVAEIPALIVVADGRIRGRLTKPSGCTQISDLLAPWLR